LIAAGIGGAASLGSAAIGANASKTASQQQVQEQQLALAQQKQMFGVAQGALDPFINAGSSVLPTLQGLLTPGTSASTLSQMPGFGFQSQYGTMAATNALSAKSGASAGPLATAISQYNNGLAGTTWQNTVNALQGFANTGAGAAGSLAGNAIASGNSQAGTLTNTGNALASGTLGSANALSGGLGGAAGSASNALLLNQLFGAGGGGGLYGGTPGTSIGGATGPTSFGGSAGPMPLVQ
jgi:hypothetical protein